MRAIYRQLKSLGATGRRQVLAMKLRSLGADTEIDGTVRFDHPDRISVGNGVKISHCSVLRGNSRYGIQLADQCFIQDFCLLNANEGAISMGERSWLGAGGHIYGNGHVTIGRDVLIGAQVIINTVSHHHGDLTRPINDQGIHVDPVVIEDNVWIGAGVRILQGVRIGEGAIIGAGSLVSRDVPPNAIAYGTPARVQSWRTLEKVA